MSKILITGATGLLGSELMKSFPEALSPDRESLDIDNPSSISIFFDNNEISTVIHCAACMPPSKADKTPNAAILTNIVGTSLITNECIKRNTYLVYISTDYVYKGDRGNYSETDELLPVNKYAWSKLGGECAVRMYSNGLVIHTTFGSNEFPYDKAFTNQLTSKETVDIIAKKISKAVEKKVTGVLNVGGKTKTVFEYAVSISPEKEIGEAKIEDMLPKYVLPKDTTLNTEKYSKIIGE